MKKMKAFSKGLTRGAITPGRDDLFGKSICGRKQQTLVFQRVVDRFEIGCEKEKSSRNPGQVHNDGRGTADDSHRDSDFHPPTILLARI